MKLLYFNEAMEIMTKKRTAREKKRLKKGKGLNVAVPVPPEVVDKLSAPGGIPVIDPPGEARMSEVILKFAEPWLEPSDEGEFYRKAIPVAIMAWNASFLSREKQQEMIDYLIGNLGIRDQHALAFRLEVEKLIERKHAKFSDVKRYVTNYEITSSEGGFQLFVASTLPASGKPEDEKDSE